jgi:hypothetical protein
LLPPPSCLSRVFPATLSCKEIWCQGKTSIPRTLTIYHNR